MQNSQVWITPPTQHHVPSPFPPPGDSERTKFLKPTWFLQTLPTNLHLLLCLSYLSLSPSSQFSNDSSKITHSAHLIDSGRLWCLSTNPQSKRIMRSGSVGLLSASVPEFSVWDITFCRKQEGPKARSTYWTVKRAGTGAAFIFSQSQKTNKHVGY